MNPKAKNLKFIHHLSFLTPEVSSSGIKAHADENHVLKISDSHDPIPVSPTVLRHVDISQVRGRGSQGSQNICLAQFSTWTTWDIKDSIRNEVSSLGDARNIDGDGED